MLKLCKVIRLPDHTDRAVRHFVRLDYTVINDPSPFMEHYIYIVLHAPVYNPIQYTFCNKFSWIFKLINYDFLPDFSTTKLISKGEGVVGGCVETATTGCGVVILRVTWDRGRVLETGFFEVMVVDRTVGITHASSRIIIDSFIVPECFLYFLFLM